MSVGKGETWCVVGGGMLGQTLALRLAQKGHAVTLCEAAPDTGGLAAAWDVGGITWDKFYHVILRDDHRTLALLDELGLREAVLWRRSSTGFFANGRMSSLNGAVDYLRLPAIGPIAKARLAATIMLAARIRDGRPLESVAVSDWLVRWSGRAAFDAVWRPLLRAKLGNNADLASAAFIWATIRRLYLARKGGAKTEELGFVDGGYGRVLSALRGRLDENRVEVVTGCPVSSVTPMTNGLEVVTPGWTRSFDRVVSTLPAGPTSRLCDALDPQLRRRLTDVVYQGIICASVVLNRPLDGYYLTYLTDADLPFTAIVEMSALTGVDRFDGKTLVYLPRYASQGDPFWDLSDEEIEARFVDGLKRVHPDIGASDIRAFRIARVRNVMAVPTLRYSEKAPPITTNVDGFSIVNSAQITDGTLNVDATLGVVEKALPVLLSEPSGREVRTAA